MKIDAVKILRDYLISRPAISALVGTRLYSPYIPDANDKKALSVIGFAMTDENGVTEDPDLPIISVCLAFQCYGATPNTSQALYRALHDELKTINNARVDGHTIFDATQRKPPLEAVYPESDWIYVESIWQVDFRDV